MTKLKNSNCEQTQNSNCDKTHQPKLWQNSQTQIVLKLKNSNCDHTKAQITINLKLWLNSKLKLWQNSSTQIVKEKNLIETKLNLYQNSKSKIMIKLKSSNCYKIQTMTNLNLWGEKSKRSFSRKNLTP